ncbi:MAG: preprotein translocase subunit SecE [Acidobacteria bacterium]|nr:preprotein translocase subunit SecE [Acidobacteriota bacterium]
MAVADVEKVEKFEKVEKTAKAQAGGTGSGGDGGGPLKQAFDWLPNKWRQLRSFLAEVRAELKKVTWPGRKEVYSTTIVVMATTVFFGFYLWGLDLVFSRVLQQVLQR